jgi:hypothetical protein
MQGVWKGSAGSYLTGPTTSRFPPHRSASKLAKEKVRREGDRRTFGLDPIALG